MLRKTAIAAVLMVSAGVVQADAERGVSLGIGVARHEYSLNPDEWGGLSGSRKATGYEAFVGYRFNRYIGLEASYFDGGSADVDLAGERIRLDGKGYGGSVVGSLPLGDYFAVFARAGYMKGELKGRIVGLSGSVEDSDQAPIYGAGIRTMFDGAQIRLEYDKVDFDAVDTDRVSLNLLWLL